MFCFPVHVVGQLKIKGLRDSVAGCDCLHESLSWRGLQQTVGLLGTISITLTPGRCPNLRPPDPPPPDSSSLHPSNSSSHPPHFAYSLRYWSSRQDVFLFSDVSNETVLSKGHVQSRVTRRHLKGELFYRESYEGYFASLGVFFPFHLTQSCDFKLKIEMT